MKKLLLLALIATTFFACSQQEEFNDNSNAGKTSLSVKIDLSKFNTRSGDEVIDLLPDWSYLLLVAKNSGGSEIREKLVPKADFENGVIQIFEKEPVNFTGGTIEAYIITEGSDWGIMTAINTVNLPVLEVEQPDINNWQLSGYIKAGVAGKFTNVPYYGIGDITDNGPGGDGHHQLSATVSVIPELGRIQVLNTPKVGGQKNNNEVTSIEVTNLYINKITSNGSVIDIRTQNNGQNVESGGKWMTDFYSEGKTLAGMTDTGKDKGYQIFDGNTPHIIVSVKYQLDHNTTKTYSGYLTLTKFTYSGATGDLTISKGKIYNIDLSKLQPTYDKIGDDPYDDTTYYDLNVEVDVKNWTIIEVTPEL